MKTNFEFVFELPEGLSDALKLEDAFFCAWFENEELHVRIEEALDSPEADDDFVPDDDPDDYPEDDFDEGYEEGYEEGCEEGWEEGLKTGYATGCTEGMKVGYARGFRDGQLAIFRELKAYGEERRS